MRGVVTLAAAFVIPADFEHREVLLLIAFTVVAGTLFLQGLTLPCAGPHAQGARPRTRSTTRWPGPPCCSRRRRPASRRSTRWSTTTRTASSTWSGSGSTSGTSPPGSGSATTADEETPSDLYSRVRRDDDRRRARAGAGDPEVRHRAVRGRRRRARDARRRGVDAGDRPARSARRSSASTRPRRRFGQVVRGPRAVPEPSTSTRRRSARPAWSRARGGWRCGRCLDCGNVGCCDSSPRQHATRHFHETTHPVMQSAEPGEDWRWCYVHHLTG